LLNKAKFTIKKLFYGRVLYKGHASVSYAQLSTTLSFTLFYKGHKILVGPERASRYLQSSPLKQLQRRTLGIPLKEIFQKTIEYYLQKTQIKNVHNNPPT
jgi:hypothetical protein